MDFKKLQSLGNYSSQLVDQIKRELGRKKDCNTKQLLEGLKSALDCKPSKRQLDYILAIALLALNAPISDKKRKQAMEVEKLALNFLTKLIDIQAYNHSFAVLLFLKYLLNGSTDKEEKWNTISHSLVRISQLFRINFISNNTANQVVQVYFIRALQVMHGLGYADQLNIEELVNQPDGLDFWIANSNMKSQSCDNLFKVFYKLSGSSKGRTLIQNTSCCLKYYLQVETFQPEIVDKMLHQFSFKINDKEMRQQDLFQSYSVLISPLKLERFKFARLSIIGWLTSLIDLATQNNFDFHPIHDFIIGISKDESIQILLSCLPEFQSNFLNNSSVKGNPPLKNYKFTKFDALLFNMLVSSIQKSLHSSLEAVFQEYLTGKTKQTSKYCNYTILFDWIVSIARNSNLVEVQELQNMICNSCVMYSQILVMIEDDYKKVQELIEFAQKTYPNSLYLSKKYESFTYNLSVYLMNKKNLENALWLIELSLNLSELLQRTKDQLIPRKILHLQCLSALGRHSECAEIARENICSDSTIDVKHLETLVMLFSMASFKRNPQNHEFLIQSSEISEEKLLKLVNLEYKSIFLYCRDNLMDDIQQKFLDSVSTIRRRLPLQTALNYSVKNLQLSRKLGKRDTQDKCNALIDYINSLDMQDSAISNYLAISTCELFLWKAEQKEIDLKLLQNAFKVWNDIFVELPVIKAFSPNVDSPFDNFGELQDYLGALKLYVALAFAYIDLGYSGKAGLALTTAKSFFENCNSEGQRLFNLAYCFYLNSVGNMAKCKDYRAKAAISDGDHLPLEIDFHLAFRAGEFEHAYDLAMRCYRTIAKYLRKSDGDQKAIKALCDSLVNLNTVLVHQGQPSAAEYYLKQGLSVAEKFHSNYYTVTFTGLLSDLYRMQERVDESLSLISNAKDERIKILDLATLDATLHMVQGDIYAAPSISKENDSYEEYQLGIAQLQSIISPTTPLLPVELDEKELVRYFRQSSAQKKDLNIFTDLYNKYVALESLKAKIMCKAANHLSDTGKIKEAAATLQTASLLSILKSDKTLYNFAVAKLKLNQFLQKLLKINFMEMFSESVFCLPWNTPSSRNREISPTNKKILDQVELTLKDAFASSWETGNSDECHQIGHNLVLVQMIKVYILQYKFNVFEICDYLLLLMEIPQSLYLSRQRPRKDSSIIYSPSSLEYFQANFLNCIPEHLVFCSISIDPSKKYIVLSRASRNSRVLFKLPLTRFATREGGINGEGFDYDDAARELEEIMSLNKSTTQNAKNCKDSKDRNSWFQSRKELDQRLDDLLRKMEFIWFGGFKGLISPQTIPATLQKYVLNFQSKVGKLIFSAISKYLPKGSKCNEIELGLCEVILALGTAAQFEEVEDVLYFLLDSYQSKGYIIDYEEVNMEELRDDMLELISQFYFESNFKKDLMDYEKHVVIIPDKCMQCFPWESIPILRGKPVSRLPSYMLAQQRLPLNTYLDIKKTVYVLNPSGDLKKTQNTFQSLLESRNWSGYVGAPPNVESFKQDLEESNLFLYFGHGAGESIIGRNELESLKKIPVSLIFGCSSGKLKWKGQFDPSGMAQEYLSLGCPLVVGNLWDVTDLDIDRFTIEMLTKWGVFPGCKRQYSICEAAATARPSCKLPFIVGAAPVIYGLPLYIKK